MGDVLLCSSGGGCVVPSLQEEENQEKAVTQVLARLGGSTSPAWWDARAEARLCTGPGWELMCKPRTSVLWGAACSQGSDHCNPFYCFIFFFACSPKKVVAPGEQKGNGELGEPSLEAQPYGGKKQLMGVRGRCFPPGGQFTGLQPLRVRLPSRVAVPGTAAAAQDAG